MIRIFSGPAFGHSMASVPSSPFSPGSLSRAIQKLNPPPSLPHGATIPPPPPPPTLTPTLTPTKLTSPNTTSLMSARSTPINRGLRMPPPSKTIFVAFSATPALRCKRACSDPRRPDFCRDSRSEQGDPRERRIR